MEQRFLPTVAFTAFMAMVLFVPGSAVGQTSVDTWTPPLTVWGDPDIQGIFSDGQANRIYYEPRCHEGNYGLPGLLSGARAEEQAFTEGRGPDPATRCIAIGGNCGGVDEEDNRDPLSAR